MLTAAVFVPGAPLIVPALSGPGATDVIEFRTSVLSAAGRLADSAQQWVAVGVGDADPTDVWQGTFAGFGVDERVSLRADDAGPDDSVSAAMATPMLVAGWIRGQVARSATICPTLVDPSAPPQECARIGTDLGIRIAGTETAVGLLVVADGSFGLTPGAPGGEIGGAAAVQTRVEAAVSDGDLDAIEALRPQECADAGIVGRAAWQVAAAVWRAAAASSPPAAETTYRAAPFGVGYQVAWWGR